MKISKYCLSCLTNPPMVGHAICSQCDCETQSEYYASRAVAALLAIVAMPWWNGDECPGCAAKMIGDGSAPQHWKFDDDGLDCPWLIAAVALGAV